jgi:hypothetical protein
VPAVSLLTPSAASAAPDTAVAQVQVASVPSAPTNLRAVTDPDGSLFAIAWDAPASAGQVSYRVDDQSGNLWSTSKTSVSMWELVYDSCIGKNTTHTVTVTAISSDDHQLSAPSNSLTFTIPKAPRRP